MPKFNKTLDELETRFDKWLYVLKNLHKLQELPPKLQERIFKKIFKVAEIAKMTKEEYAEYEHSKKVFNDYKNTMDTAKEIAREEGLAEGEAKGEKNAKIAIAKKMLSKGIDIAEIADMTGLTAAQIKAL